LGDPQIVRFVNETLNADRGYSKKSQLTLNGSVTHELQESRTVEDILGMISLSAQREVLAALEGKLPPRQLNPVEVEVQSEREDED
jgi:sulfur carrier protein ThiS